MSVLLHSDWLTAITKVELFLLAALSGQLKQKWLTSIPINQNGYNHGKYTAFRYCCSEAFMNELGKSC